MSDTSENESPAPAPDGEFPELQNLSPDDGLLKTLMAIERVKHEHSARLVKLNKLAQSYRAKARWERERKPVYNEAGERVLDINTMSRREANALLKQVRKENELASHKLKFE